MIVWLIMGSNVATLSSSCVSHFGFIFSNLLRNIVPYFRKTIYEWNLADIMVIWVNFGSNMTTVELCPT